MSNKENRIIQELEKNRHYLFNMDAGNTPNGWGVDNSTKKLKVKLYVMRIECAFGRVSER